MRVAEILVDYSAFFSHAGFQARVGYDDLEKAKAEFERVKGMLEERMKDRDERLNGAPRMVHLEGISRLSVPLSEIAAIGFVDLAQANEHEKGLRDTYPHLHWKPVG